METMSDAGFGLTENEIKSMTLLIGVLAILHMLALIMELAGETIVNAWRDDDGDGVPNWADKKNNKPSQQPQPQKSQQPPALRQFANDTEEIEALQKRLAELNPTSGAQSQQPPQPK